MSLQFMGVPMDTFVDLSDHGAGHAFLTAWCSRDRCRSAHVHFQTTTEAGQKVVQDGTFKFALDIRPDDPDLLKVQVLMRMRDEETKNRRTAELCITCADMRAMLEGKTDRFQVAHPFNTDLTVEISLRICNARDLRNRLDGPGDQSNPVLRLRPSSLRQIERLNQDVGGISDAMTQTLQRVKGQTPPGGNGFIPGESLRPFYGRIDPETGKYEIPPLKTHYTVLGAQQEMISRPAPIPVFLYHQYLRIVHSGKTIQEVLALPDEDFAPFYLQGCPLNCDAGLFPYEKDFVPGLGLTDEEEITLVASGTEDLGWPGTEGTYCGRSIRERRPIKALPSMSMDELRRLFVQDPVDPTSYQPLVPDLEFMPRALAQPPARRNRRVLQELYLQYSTDDCESSALMADIMRMTSLKIDAQLKGKAGPGRGRALQAMCSDWKVFRKFTDASWQAMALYVDRGNRMLQAGQLRLMCAAGLSYQASAGDSGNREIKERCGHCFNVCSLQTPSMPQKKVWLLEGTAPMYQLPVTRTSPRVTIRNGSTRTMPEFLSALGSTLLRATLVINKPNGGMPACLKGWPLDVEITGWVARTMVMCSLDSDPSATLDFYDRVMYVGWPCTTEGLGCMPVSESKQAIVAGCHPFELTNTAVRGVNAGLDPEAAQRMRDIMDEATPPMADESIVRRLADQWIPCNPLEQVNADARREPGQKYHRISVMEAPCAPEYVSIIFEAKRRVAEEFNRINDAAPGSDGIRLYALLEGLSASLCADVPDRSIAKLTFMQSLQTALANVKYPSYDPAMWK